MAKEEKYTFKDFEEGLVLAGYITPINNAEIQQIEAIKEYNQELSKSESLIYFKRSVLAAEIVNQLYNEFTFGRVKFQKLVYLCEHVSNMDLQARYRKFAAGPFDSRFMHSIISEFKKQKWFDISYQKSNGFNRELYTPGINVEKYKKYFEKYFGATQEDVSNLIELFRKKKTRDVELVATLYYCLLEAKENHTIISEESLQHMVYKWADEKKKFTSMEINSCHDWMKSEGIIS